ncbi:MAG TPA: DNA replication/repair protein RecF [Kofleriaceae bacterium]|nr:DNA replication/repair protein RecF [Kofleriaceae bacterium]
MKIVALTAHGVRNLQPLQLVPRERFNVFIGDNGQGKTSVLEAIYVTSTLRSFRTPKLSDLIAFGQPEAKLGARVVKDELTRVYELELAPGSRKVRLDGKAVRPLSRYFGGFNVVVFTPEDLALPRGSPGDRRRFLDRGVFNFSSGYLATATDYDKVLRSRNAVLKQAGEGRLGGTQVDDMLAIYDAQLAQLAEKMVTARLQFLAALAPELSRAFSAITRTGMQATVRYASKLVAETSADTWLVEGAPRSENASPRLIDDASHAAIAVKGLDRVVPSAEIELRLRQGRARDLASQSTQLGPHRDDIVLELDGREAGSFASQGQLRAIMLAWKTAELSVLGAAHGDPPILLLDDVSSELDSARNEYLFQHLATLAGQCFITTTHGGHVLLREHRADYAIQGGRIVA